MTGFTDWSHWLVSLTGLMTGFTDWSHWLVSLTGFTDWSHWLVSLTGLTDWSHWLVSLTGLMTGFTDWSHWLVSLTGLTDCLHLLRRGSTSIWNGVPSNTAALKSSVCLMTPYGSRTSYCITSRWPRSNRLHVLTKRELKGNVLKQTNNWHTIIRVITSDKRCRNHTQNILATPFSWKWWHQEFLLFPGSGSWRFGYVSVTMPSRHIQGSQLLSSLRIMFSVYSMYVVSSVSWHVNIHNYSGLYYRTEFLCLFVCLFVFMFVAQNLCQLCTFRVEIDLVAPQ